VPQTLLVALVALGAGRTLWRNRDWRNEETLWTAALRAGSDTYRTHYNLGNAFVAQNQLAAAMAQFEAALRLYPEAPWARRNLVQVLFDRGYYADAETHLRVLVQQDGEDFEAWRSLAQVLLRQRKFDESLEAARQAIRLQPQSIEALYVQSVSLEYSDRRDEAIASYGRTLEAIAAAVARGEDSPVPARRVEARLEALEGARDGAPDSP
jgi:tetratricopeptide (TPR) repeat protein